MVQAALSWRKLEVIAVYPTYADHAAFIAYGLGIGSLGIAMGVVLVIVARSDGRPARLTLWAKICVTLGLELCLGVPVLFYGLVFLYASYTHDPTDGPVDLFDGALLVGVGSLSAIPFLLGLVMLTVAGIWGRRRAPVNVPDVFS